MTTPSDKIPDTAKLHSMTLSQLNSLIVPYNYNKVPSGTSRLNGREIRQILSNFGSGILAKIRQITGRLNFDNNTIISEALSPDRVNKLLNTGPNVEQSKRIADLKIINEILSKAAPGVNLHFKPSSELVSSTTPITTPEDLEERLLALDFLRKSQQYTQEEIQKFADKINDQFDVKIHKDKLYEFKNIIDRFPGLCPSQLDKKISKAFIYHASEKLLDPRCPYANRAEQLFMLGRMISDVTSNEYKGSEESGLKSFPIIDCSSFDVNTFNTAEKAKLRSIAFECFCKAALLGNEGARLTASRHFDKKEVQSIIEDNTIDLPSRLIALRLYEAFAVLPKAESNSSSVPLRNLGLLKIINDQNISEMTPESLIELKQVIDQLPGLNISISTLNKKVEDALGGLLILVKQSPEAKAAFARDPSALKKLGLFLSVNDKTIRERAKQLIKKEASSANKNDERRAEANYILGNYYYGKADSRRGVVKALNYFLLGKEKGSIEATRMLYALDMTNQDRNVDSHLNTSKTVKSYKQAVQINLENLLKDPQKRMELAQKLSAEVALNPGLEPSAKAEFEAAVNLYLTNPPLLNGKPDVADLLKLLADQNYTKKTQEVLVKANKNNDAIARQVLGEFYCNKGLSNSGGLAITEYLHAAMLGNEKALTILSEIYHKNPKLTLTLNENVALRTIFQNREEQGLVNEGPIADLETLLKRLPKPEESKPKASKKKWH